MSKLGCALLLNPTGIATLVFLSLRLTLITRAENYTQLTLPTFTDLYKDVLPEDEHSVEESFDALDANRDGLVTLREMYEHEPVRFSQLFPRDDADD